MIERELWALGTYGGVALLLSIIGVLAFGAVLHAERRWGQMLPLVLLPLIVLGIGVSGALSGRVLTFASTNIESIQVGAGGGTSVLRLVTISILATGLAVVIGRLFAHDRASSRDQQPLLVALCAFFVSHALLSSAFGARPEFIHGSLYAVVPFVAIYMSRDLPIERFVAGCKLALAVLMVGSLIAAVVKPSLALQPDYRGGWLPGVHFRLWGLGSNPNSIGPLALLLLLLEWLQPGRTRWQSAAVWLPAVAVLLLAQSKTAWAASLILLTVLSWYRLGKSPQAGARPAYVLAVLALLVAATLLLWFGGVDRIVARLARGQVGTDVSTLTGRVQIWAVAIETWAQSPWFGYGPLAWGPEHRLRIGMPFAFSAHNQFLESLSSAGLIGVASLLAYLTILGRAAWRGRLATRGVSLALFVLLLARSMTEAPFEMGTLLSGDLVAHLVLFRLSLVPGSANRSCRMPSLRFA